MKLLEFCINHPTKKAVAHCKQCDAPLCPDCRLLLREGIFCSDTCYHEFLDIRGRIIDEKGRRARFSVIALIKHLATAAVLLAIIAGIFYWWMGTTDPVEIWRRLVHDFRLMF